MNLGTAFHPFLSLRQVAFAALVGVLALPAAAQSPGVPATAAAASPQVLLSGPNNLAITDMDQRADAERVPPDVRRRAFSQPAGIATAASNLYVRRALAAEAEQRGLANNPQVQAALQIAKDKVLSDARLAQIDAEATPKDQASLDRYARQLYNSKPDQFKQPEQVKVRHILLGKAEPDARQKADALLAQLKAGADFAGKAKELSTDPGSRESGGDLPLGPRGRFVPEFEQAAFALTKPGDLSDVVETQFGYHIIQLQDKQPAGVLPFEKALPQLRTDVARQLVQEARTREQERLLKGAQFDQKAVEALAATYQ